MREFDFGLELLSGLLTGMFSINVALLAYVAKRMQAISLDVAVIKVYVAEALAIKEQAKADHDNVVRLDEKLKTQKKDIDALHQKARSLADKLDRFN